jgi:hypothetical protein
MQEKKDKSEKKRGGRQIAEEAGTAEEGRFMVRKEDF